MHRPSVAIGDVDGDRVDDLVFGRNGVIVAHLGTRVAPGGDPGGLGSAQRVFWFANDGSGTFTAARELPVAGGTRRMVHGELRSVDLADVDGDGHLGLLIRAGELTLHAGSAAGLPRRVASSACATAARRCSRPSRRSAIRSRWRCAPLGATNWVAGRKARAPCWMRGSSPWPSPAGDCAPWCSVERQPGCGVVQAFFDRIHRTALTSQPSGYDQR